MEILHLYKDYYPVLGGIENHIRSLAEAQATSGHKATVLVCGLGKQTQIEIMNGVQVIKAGRLLTAASMPLSLAQPLELFRGQPDIIHLHSPYPLGEVANWMLGRGKATIITYHSDIVRQKNWLRFYGFFLRRVLKAADRIVTTTPRYIELSPWLQPVRQKCQVIPIGIDLSRFSQAVSSTQPAQASVLQAQDSMFKLLFVGRLRYYKGIGTLLEALPDIPNTHLTIVGIGPMESEWKALAHQLGLTERVTFTGEIDDATLPQYYQQADLFVLPANARSEAYGIVLIEAMASGLPCVTTELGTGTSWVVQDGETGLVVPPLAPKALATAINAIRTNPVLHQQFSIAAIIRAKANFSIAAMVEKMMALYEAALV